MGRLVSFIAFLLLAVVAGADVADRPVVIGTWNLQNYLLQTRFPDGRFRPAYPMPEAQKSQIRQLILESRPDILFLQELGSAAFLKELQLDLAASGLDYPCARFSASPDARTGLAVLSVINPDEVIFHDPVPLANGAALTRGIQEVRFSFGGQRIRFFHLHLKSRYSNDPADPDSLSLRSAGFQALQRFLDRQLAHAPDSPSVLLGDFNTPLDDPLFASLRANWHLLPVTDAAGQPWTYHHRKSGSRDVIDAFFISHAAACAFQPFGLLPLDPSATPSDHRLLLVRFLQKNLATPP